MGNCMVIQGRKEIKVMSIVDDEILKALPAAPHPSKGAFAGSDDVAGSLFPAAVKAPSDDEAAVAADTGAVMRVKLVISKQELRRMLGKDRTVSLDDMVALMRRGSEEEEQEQEQEQESCRGWRPALHSIPEGSSDLF